MPFKPIKNLDPNDGLNEVRIDLINKYRVIASSNDASMKQQLHALARIEFLSGFSAVDPGDPAEDAPAPKRPEAPKTERPDTGGTGWDYAPQPGIGAGVSSYRHEPNTPTAIQDPEGDASGEPETVPEQPAVPEDPFGDL